jgi:hypothetical protein
MLLGCTTQEKRDQRITRLCPPQKFRELPPSPRRGAAHVRPHIFTRTEADAARRSAPPDAVKGCTTVTAGLLAFGGLVAHTVAGPARRGPAEAAQQ